MERFAILPSAMLKEWVSIPFKRESTWKAAQFSVFSVLVTFQFPSNGKAHGKVMSKGLFRVPQHLFQFPSNGKAHGKDRY